MLISSSASLWALSFLENFALGPTLHKSTSKFFSKQISASYSISCSKKEIITIQHNIANVLCFFRY